MITSRVFCAWLITLGAVVVGHAPSARAAPVNLGRNWTATAPAGYDVTPDIPQGKMLGDEVPLGGSTTLALPVKLVVPNWNTLNPIDIKFVNNTAANTPPPNDHFALRLEITNKTGVAWNAFSFWIFDDNNTPRDNQPNLIHPFKAHYHVNFFEPQTMGFKKLRTDPLYDHDLIDPLTLTDRGVYEIKLFGGHLINPNAMWSPTVFDLHDRPKLGANGNHITAFTIRLQPHAVPEPNTIALALAGLVPLVCMQHFRRRFGRKSVAVGRAGPPLLDSAATRMCSS